MLHDPDLPPMVNAFPGTERFLCRECLGSGSFGSVYKVFDRDRQFHVALKVPHETAARSLFLFKKEFRILADVSHPNVVRLHELIWDDSRWFFTMEFVDGVDILRYLRASSVPLPPSPGPESGELLEDDGEDLPAPSPPGDYARVVEAFSQLASGLMAIHAAGLLHMDIKPSNVLVAPDGHVVLLDFGLSTEIDSSLETPQDSSEITGTPAYMAPEQLLDNRCSEASDWYSVGVLLYYVLTGRLPFQGKGLRALVNKVSHLPISPGLLLPQVPPELSHLCMDLLDPRPENRPVGAHFLERLLLSGLGATSPALQPGRREFLGREDELKRLFQAFQSLEEGRAGWVNLHGGSGLGKTFLLKKFKGDLAQAYPETLILSGRCYEQEHVPYKALDGLVDELSRHLRQLPPSQLDELLPRHTYALAQLFPVLEQVQKILELQKRHSTIADPAELRHRAFSALRELLCRIAESGPLVLIIDDLQWGDADSAVLLRDLLSPPGGPLLLMVVSYREEETATSPVLREFLSVGRAVAEECVDVPLQQLSFEEAGAFARGLLGEGAGEEFIDWVALESGGSPYFIQELVQQAIRGGGTTLSGGLDTFVRSRIESMPPASRSILELVALTGYPLDWQILKTASDAGPGALDFLDLLRQSRLVRIRTVESHRMVEPYHDFIRKAVTSSLSPEEARRGHLKLARELESASQPDVQALAFHYREAGEIGKAVDYLTTAGLQAASTLAFAKAASLFRMSLELREPDDPASWGIWALLGDALSNAGRGAEAAHAFLKAASHASPRESHRLKRSAAQEFLKCGHYEEGLACLEEVLKSVGVRLAPTRLMALLSTIFHRLRIALWGHRVTMRRASELPPRVLDRLDAYWAITMGLATGDILRAADFQARHLLLGLQAGEPMRMIRALAYEAIFASARGSRSQAATRRHLERVLARADQMGDPGSMTQALLAVGLSRMSEGSWRKAAECLDEVETRLREDITGLTYELRNAQSYALVNHYALGHLRLIAERLPGLLREAEESGDLLFQANLRTGSVFIHDLAQDQPEAARREILRIMGRFPRVGYSHQRFNEMTALGNIDLYRGARRTGWTEFLERLETVERSGLLVVQIIRVTALELKGRMALALAGEEADRQPFLAEAGRCIARLQRERVPYALALARRLQALLAALTGRLDEARERAFLAESDFEACDMALHAHTLRYWRGQLKGPAGSQLIQEAESWMRQQGILSPAHMTAMFLPCPGVPGNAERGPQAP